MKKELPMPIIAVCVTVAVIALGVFLFRGVTGGVQGDGRSGHTEAAPPMSKAAQEQMMSARKK